MTLTLAELSSLQIMGMLEWGLVPSEPRFASR